MTHVRSVTENNVLKSLKRYTKVVFHRDVLDTQPFVIFLKAFTLYDMKMRNL